MSQWGQRGTGDGEFRGPTGIALYPFGGIFVTDGTNQRVQVFVNDSDFLLDWGRLGSQDGEFLLPRGVVATP